MKKNNKTIATITFILCLSALFSLPNATFYITSDNTLSYIDISLYNDEIIDTKN